MLGQLRSCVILDSKTKRTTFQIHHIALSAYALFRLTLPRTRIRYLLRIPPFPRDTLVASVATRLGGFGRCV